MKILILIIFSCSAFGQLMSPTFVPSFSSGGAMHGGINLSSPIQVNPQRMIPFRATPNQQTQAQQSASAKQPLRVINNRYPKNNSNIMGFRSYDRINLKDHKNLAEAAKIYKEKLSTLRNEEINEAKKILAYEVTKLVRGKEDADEALEIADNIFNSNINDTRLPNISEKKLNLREGIFTILDAIEKLELVKSRSEIKRLIKSDGVRVNDELYKNSNLSLKEYAGLKEIKISIGKKKIGILKIL